MPFELPALHVNPPFSWGPPEEEITIDGQTFELHFKKTPLYAVDWLPGFQKHLDEFTNEKPTGAFRSVIDINEKKKFDKTETKNRKVANYNYSQSRQRRPYERPRKIAELPSSVPILGETTIYAEFPQHEMLKYEISSLPKVEDLLSCGHPFVYDSSVNDASCARPRLLNETTYSPDYFERPDVLDPHMQKLIHENAGKVPLIVTTDEVLSLIMSSYFSIHPWHIVVSSPSRALKLFVLEKEADSNVDRQWVSETAPRDVAPTEDDDIISERISSLGEESTRIHNCFIKESCLRSRGNVKVTERVVKSTFTDIHPRLYRYRRYMMNMDSPSKRYDIIVRCEVDAVDQANNLVRLFALLEQCRPGSTSVWRKDLVTNKAAALPMSYSLNKAKIIRWIALSHLSNVNFMKIGFVARTEKGNRVDPEHHEVISVQSEAPLVLASHLGIRVRTMWAVVDTIIQKIMEDRSDDNDMVLVKPSGSHKIILAEKQDDDEEEEEEEEQEEGTQTEQQENN